jgi:hypothetical protein
MRTGRPIPPLTVTSTERETLQQSSVPGHLPATLVRLDHVRSPPLLWSWPRPSRLHLGHHGGQESWLKGLSPERQRGEGIYQTPSGSPKRRIVVNVPMELDVAAPEADRR